MRKAYYTLDLIEAALLKDYLVQNGVGATLMNKGLIRIPHPGAVRTAEKKTPASSSSAGTVAKLQPDRAVPVPHGLRRLDAGSTSPR